MATSEELQKAAEAAEERLSDVLDEVQLAGYWQERLTVAEARAQQPAESDSRNSSGWGAAGRAESEKRFRHSGTHTANAEPLKRADPGAAGHAEAAKRFQRT